jgi:hypothetical protein
MSITCVPYFVPTSITGCSLWFDATDSSTITLSSGSLTRWNDKSGNARNFNAVSGYANATVSSAYQYGLNVFNFSGNGLYRTSADTAVYPQDVYIVLALKDTTTRVDVLGMGATSTDNFNSLTLGEYTASRWHNGSSGFYRTPSCVAPANETSTSFLLMQWSLANNNFLLRRNGTQLVQTSSYTFTPSSGAVYQLGLRYPHYTGGGMDAPFIGYIGEIVVFNSQLGTTDRQNVESYLAQKWGLTASLPAGHPGATSIVYKSPSFIPMQISNCSLWLDASDTNTFTGTTTITAWKDKVNGYSFAGTATAASAIGGTNIGCLSFNGSSQYLTFSNSSVFINAPYTVFTVGYQLNNALGRIINGIKPGSTDGVLYVGGWSGSTGTAFVGDGGNWNPYPDTAGSTRFGNTVNTWALTCCTVSNTASTSVLNSYFNGVTQTVQTGSILASSLGGMNIGGGVGITASAGQQWYGYIGEVIFYNFVLSSGQRQQVEAYLSQKWNLTSTLSSDHLGATSVAFKSSLPLLIPVPFTSLPYAFAPTQITGCSLWLDGSDSSTMFQNTAATTAITADGQTIGAWRDKSSNAYLFTQATTGNQPTYKVGILNGCSLTRWNGTSSGLQSSTTIPFYTSASSGGSFFFVFMITNNSSQHFLMTYQNQTYGTFCISESEIGCPTGNGDTGNFGIHQGCSKANVALSQITTNTYVLMNLNLLSSGTAPANTTIYKNGTSASITAQNGGFYSGTTYPYANNARYLNIGYRVPNGAYPIDCWLPGDIAEIVWYQNPVTDTQRQQVEAYLAQKWGLTSSLAATHPGLTTTYYNSQSILNRAALTVAPKLTKIPIILSGLTNRWILNEGSGSVFFDSVAGQTGTLIGATSWVTVANSRLPSLTKAIYFANTSGNGNSQYGQIAAGGIAINTLTTANWSISLWFYSLTFVAQGADVYLAINSPTVRYWNFYIGNGSGNLYNYTPYSGSTSISGTVATNAWSHIVYTCSSSSITVYVNGSSAGTGTWPSFSFPSNTFLTLGIENISGSLQYGVNMYMQDVRIYNRALTSTEVTSIYNNLG